MYLLRKGEHTVLVSPQGGSILGWWWQDCTILGPPRVMRIGDKLKTRGVTHACFPYFGSWPAGNTSEHPKHGNFRNTVLLPDTDGADYARFRMLPDLSNSMVEVVIEVKVDAGGGIMWFIATNRGDKPIPILPGVHPYFATPAYGANIWVNGSEVGRVSESGDAYQIQPEALVWRRGSDKEILVNLENIGAVELKAHYHCTNVVVWSDRPAEYFCVEPVFGTPGTLGNPTSPVLQPSDETYCEVNFRFTAL